MAVVPLKEVECGVVQKEGRSGCALPGTGL